MKWYNLCHDPYVTYCYPTVTDLLPNWYNLYHDPDVTDTTITCHKTIEPTRNYYPYRCRHMPQPCRAVHYVRQTRFPARGQTTTNNNNTTIRRPWRSTVRYKILPRRRSRRNDAASGNIFVVSVSHPVRYQMASRGQLAKCRGHHTFQHFNGFHLLSTALRKY